MTTRKITQTITSFEHSCARCGFVWTSKLEDPAACKKCKNRGWRTPATIGRGRPRTLPDELRDDLKAYNREAKRRSRANKGGLS